MCVVKISLAVFLAVVFLVEVSYSQDPNIEEWDPNSGRSRLLGKILFRKLLEEPEKRSLAKMRDPYLRKIASAGVNRNNQRYVMQLYVCGEHPGSDDDCDFDCDDLNFKRSIDDDAWGSNAGYSGCAGLSDDLGESMEEIENENRDKRDSNREEICNACNFEAYCTENDRVKITDGWCFGVHPTD